VHVLCSTASYGYMFRTSCETACCRFNVAGGPSAFGRNLQCKPVRGVNFREECRWSHACSLEANMRGVHEWKFLSENAHRTASLLPVGWSHPLDVLACTRERSKARVRLQCCRAIHGDNCQPRDHPRNMLYANILDHTYDMSLGLLEESMV
jgi:hypothetical protein